MNQPKINFGSENFAGVQPEIMNALAAANTGQVPSYGNDAYSQATVELFKQEFGDNIDVYFTFNGTGANNFGIGAVVERYQSIFCTDVSHLFVDESTAPETFIGCRIYPVNSANGKISVTDLRARIKRVNDIHHPQARIVTLTQPTEYGTVYSIEELRQIKAVCTEHAMLLHVDGARFFNAAASLGGTLKEITADAGVDILTLGGTKIGMMFGEAVIFFNPVKPPTYKFNLKRSMQLASKNRFIAVQFQAVLLDELWRRIATHANQLALSFSKAVTSFPEIELAYPVDTNAVFLKMPKAVALELQEFATFYLWNEARNEYRFMFSFDSTQEEADLLCERLREVLSSQAVDRLKAVQ